MNDSTIDLDWTEEEILTCEASDEELEAAAISLEGITFSFSFNLFQCQFCYLEQIPVDFTRSLHA